MENFVTWKICIVVIFLAFVLSGYWLLKSGGIVRRRKSSLIDLIWTSTSAIAIFAALWNFSDIIRSEYQQQIDSRFLAGLDEIVKADGKMLISLNCRDGRPLSVIINNHSPCSFSSRLMFWLKEIDINTKEIKKFCKAGDENFSSRNFETSTSKLNTTGKFWAASCYSLDSSTPCMQARCKQERNLINIHFDMLEMRKNLYENTFINDKYINSKNNYNINNSVFEEIFYNSQFFNMAENIGLEERMKKYYEITKEINELSVKKDYSSMFFLDRILFFVFLPIWSAIFGARLARPVAEMIDPDGKGGIETIIKFVAKNPNKSESEK